MAIILGFSRHDARLAVNLFKMNLRDRYLGSALGSFWAIANPIFLLAVYTFVFGFVFKIRLPGSEATLDYVLWLISGYGPWMATTESVMSATTSVVGAAGIVKNIVFKTELLPIAATMLGAVSLTVSLLFLLVLMLVSGHRVSWHVALLPVIIGIHFLFVCAIGIWLAAINVFTRDLGQVLPNLLTVLMFVTPVFYSIESVPGPVALASLANPFYVIVDAYRCVVVNHTLPAWHGLVYVALLGLLILMTGLRAFRRVKGRFDSAL